MPALVPTVISAGGQRLLLSDTDVEVRYDSATKSLVVNPPGWWVINYPFTRIQGLEGKSADQISQLLFGAAREVRNWYVKTPEESELVSEPAAPTQPAPIELTQGPALVVINRHPRAADSNPGTLRAPLKTISAAVRRIQPGTLIRVYPGVYRETVEIEQSGTAKNSVRLEGVRDRNGQMPVISGNDLFPPRAWMPVEGLPGMYRADLFTKQLGPVSAAGRTLVERILPQELAEGEFALNHASREFLNLRVDGNASPREGESKDGRTCACSRRMKRVSLTPAKPMARQPGTQFSGPPHMFGSNQRIETPRGTRHSGRPPLLLRRQDFPENRRN